MSKRPSACAIVPRRRPVMGSLVGREDLVRRNLPDRRRSVVTDGSDRRRGWAWADKHANVPKPAEGD
jgi:hypothetical protein